MDEARLSFTMTATVADAAAPPAAAEEQLSIDWVRIPISLDVTLPPEATQGAGQAGSARNTGPSGSAARRSAPPGTATNPYGGGTSEDGPSPAGAPRTGRDERRPTSTGALNSLGLAATFGRRAASQPVRPASFNDIGNPSPPTPADAATPDGPEGGESPPTPGTGQTNGQTNGQRNGTTGSRALDMVFKAGKIGALHRAAATSRDGPPG